MTILIHDSTTCRIGVNGTKCDMCEFAEKSARKHAESPSMTYYGHPRLDMGLDHPVSEAKNVLSGQETPGMALPAPNSQKEAKQQ